MWCCFKKSKDTVSARELQHNIRRREIEGCVKCGREIRPGKELMVCGMRFERWTVCLNCYENNHLEFKTPMYSEEVLWEVDPGPALMNCTTVSLALEAVFNVYSDRPCLGFLSSLPKGDKTRKGNIVKDCERSSSKHAFNDYCWLTYENVGNIAKYIGIGLKSLLTKRLSNMVNGSDTSNVKIENHAQKIPSVECRNVTTILLYAEASIEWYLMQYACILERLLIVPTLDGTPKHQVKEIIDKCLPSIIITCPDKYETVQSILRQNFTDNQTSQIQPLSVMISSSRQRPHFIDSIGSKESLDNAYYTSDIVKLGKHGESRKEKDILYNSEDDGIKEDIPRMLIPTSGSTGTPKLIIVTDSMMLRQFKPPSFGVRTVLYSFQPIRQSFDTLVKGGRIGLWSGNLGDLHRDMKILRPTHFASTPVFWLAQLQKFNSEMRHLEMIEGKDMNNERNAELRSNLISKWRDKRLLGNRCKAVLIGGAPSSEELRKWIWDVFGVSVTDGYGTSETGAIATNADINDQSYLQLIDEPDLGYMTSDVPYPRGEIVVFTKRMTPGYFNDPIANENSFMMIGEKKFFRTGDIGMLMNGKISIIDRKKSLFKLPNGVFVAPAPLETLFGQSSLINQALVFGSPGSRTVNALVVLTSMGIKECSNEMEHVADSKLDPRPILRECSRLAIEASRKEYEIPQRIILSTEEWTVENGCLTSSLKPCRPVLMKKFVHDLHGDSEEYLVNQKIVTSNFTSTSDGTSGKCSGLSAGLEQILRETIPQFSSFDVEISSLDSSLYSLGMDSLALATLRSAIQSRFGINIPLPHLAEATLLDLNTAVLGGGIQCLSDKNIESKSLESEVDGICKSWKNGRKNKNDLKCDAQDTCQNMINDDTIGDLSSFKKVVLVTGATGFVGAFLLEELIRRNDDFHVICLVRAECNNTARDRLELELQKYSIECNHTRWSVIAGDLAKDKLALSKSEWNTLVDNVSLVFHVGAIVNASLPLAAIHSANVVGTKTIVEFCVAANAKLHHISTASVLGGSGVTEETLDVPEPVKYSSAYAKSKWLSEQIVGRGIIDLGLQANIYRLGTMACHSKTGACNQNDTFTRIIKGLISLRAFTTDEGSYLPKGFYLAPIDWAVKVLCIIALRSSDKTKDKLKLNKGLQFQDQAEVFHILSNNFLQLSIAFNCIINRGINLEHVSTSEFRDRLAKMDESNEMFTLRDRFQGGLSSKSPSLTLSTQKTNRFADPCPVVDENTILQMLKYLKY